MSKEPDVILEALRAASIKDLIGILIQAAMTSCTEYNGMDFEKSGILASEMWDKTQVVLEEKGYYYNISSFPVFMKQFMEDERGLSRR